MWIIADLFTGAYSPAMTIATIVAAVVPNMYYTGRVVLHAQAATRHLRHGDPEGDYSVLSAQLHEEKRWGRGLS